eukprot:3339046-Ditylum_brightwellii.AAC.1
MGCGISRTSCFLLFFLLRNGRSYLLPLDKTQNVRKAVSSALYGQSRRNVLASVSAAGIQPFLPFDASASVSTAPSSTKPLADLPMIRLKLPKDGLGREYVVIKLNIGGETVDFMVDSGLTTEMITPHLKDMLHIPSGSSTIRGLAAGGSTDSALVELKDVSLCCGEFANGRTSLPLPPLHAVVTDFVQEHIDPDHNVEGMIGMELLEMFDVDFDFPKNRIRFYPPQKSEKDDLIPIPAVVLNESGLEGIRIRSLQQKIGQPMLGIIDCGASFSIMNTAAAKLLGLNIAQLSSSLA